MAVTNTLTLRKLTHELEYLNTLIYWTATALVRITIIKIKILRSSKIIRSELRMHL